MINLLIITHGDFAQGILSASQMLAGEHEGVEAIGLYPGKDFEEFKADVHDAIERLAGASEGDGCLVMVDLFGGSPSNACAFASGSLIEKGVKFDVVTGINMPMLIEAVMSRDFMSIEELKEHITGMAKDGVKDMLADLGLRD